MRTREKTLLDPWQVRAEVERAMVFIGEIRVEKLRDRPKTGEVESTRRCNQRKGDTSCSLWRDSFQKEQNPVYRKVNQEQRLRRVAHR